MTILILAFVMFMQPGPQFQPAPAPGASNTTTNVTNVYPVPDKAFILDTQRDAAGPVLEGGFSAFDADAAKRISTFLDIGTSLSKVQQDFITQPIVQDMMRRSIQLVTASIAAAIAAVVLWGMIGHVFGSDVHEVIEVLGHIPLWALLAISTLAWYTSVLRIFGAMAGVFSSTSHEVFGEALEPSKYGVSLGMFGLIIGALCLIWLFFFALKLWLNTVFLAFALAVGPIFVFSMATPWTKRWGTNWFRMVPGTAGELVAMSAILGMGGPALGMMGQQEPFNQMALRLGLLMIMPLVQRLFGIEHNSFGSRIFGAIMIARIMRELRNRGSSGGARPVPAAAAPLPSPTSPTRAPRWTMSGRSGGRGAGTAAWGKA